MHPTLVSCLRWEKYRRVYENVSLLLFLQALNYIFPLITLPYLARVLGLEKFGILALALSAARWMEVVTGYGFEATATREISRNREDVAELSEIVSAVMLIKGALLVLGYGILFLVVTSIEKFSAHRTVFLLTYGIVVANGTFPLWFFQGLERMRVITLLNLASRVLYTGSVFLFIGGESDYLYVPVLNFASSGLIGLVSIGIVKRLFHVRFHIVSFATVIRYLKTGFYNFSSAVASVLFNTTNVLVLGMLQSSREVAIYVGAERIIAAIYSMSVPVVNGIYPYIANRITTDPLASMNLFRKVTRGLGGIFLLVSVAVLMLADWLVPLVLGSQFVPSIPVMKVFAFLPVVIALNMSINILYLLAMDLDQLRTRNYLLVGILNAVSCYFLTMRYSYLGTALSFTFSQVIFLLASLYTYRRHFRVTFRGGT